MIFDKPISGFVCQAVKTNCTSAINHPGLNLSRIREPTFKERNINAKERYKSLKPRK